MLPAKNRLKTADFKLIKGLNKKYFSSDNFSLKVVYTDFNPSRFAIIVSSSVFKKAVLRNRLKRRLKAVVFSFLNSFKLGLAIVIYPKKEVTTLTHKELKDEICSLFKKSKILKNV